MVLKENPIIVLYLILVSSYFATYQMYIYLMPLSPCSHIRFDHQCELCGSRDIHPIVYQSVSKDSGDSQDDAWADSFDGRFWSVHAVPGTDPLLLCRDHHPDIRRGVVYACGEPVSDETYACKPQRADQWSVRSPADRNYQYISVGDRICI